MTSDNAPKTCRLHSSKSPWQLRCPNTWEGTCHEHAAAICCKIGNTFGLPLEEKHEDVINKSSLISFAFVFPFFLFLFFAVGGGGGGLSSCLMSLTQCYYNL